MNSPAPSDSIDVDTTIRITSTVGDDYDAEGNCTSVLGEEGDLAFMNSEAGPDADGFVLAFLPRTKMWCDVHVDNFEVCAEA